MRRFALTLALFLAPLICSAIYVEWKLAEIPNNYTRKRDIIAGAGVEARVAVLGSSRDLNDISPQEFDCPGVNLANVAESLFYSTEVMKQELRTSRELRLVIQGLTHMSYEYQLSGGSEQWRGFHYHRFLGTRLDGGLSRFDTRDLSLVALYGQRSVLTYAGKGFDVDLVDPMDDTGWSPLFGPPIDPADESVARARAAVHASLMKASYLRENLDALEAMVNELDGRGIRVALAVTPVMPAYARSIRGDTLARMQSETAALAARHGLLYRDYTSDPRFETSDFYNCDHLTPNGAVKYSRILNEEIVRPLGACGTTERPR